MVLSHYCAASTRRCTVPRCGPGDGGDVSVDWPWGLSTLRERARVTLRPMSGGSTVGSNDRLRRIESVTDTALAHLDVEDLFAELLDRVRDLLQADTAVVLLLDPASQQLLATAARGLEGEVRQGLRLPVGRGFVGRVAAEKQPVTIEHVDHTNVVDPVLRNKGLRSLLGVPMLTGGTLMGVLHVGTLAPRRFTDDDIEVLRLVADRVALATQARISDIDRAAATALQRSLLPTRLPAMPGIELAARTWQARRAASAATGTTFSPFRPARCASR